MTLALIAAAGILGALLLAYAAMSALSDVSEVDAGPVPVAPERDIEKALAWATCIDFCDREPAPMREMSGHEPARIDDSTAGVFDWLKANYSPKPVDTAGIQPAPRKE